MDEWACIFLAKRGAEPASHDRLWSPLPAGSVGPRVPAHLRDHDIRLAVACRMVTERSSCQRATDLRVENCKADVLLLHRKEDVHILTMRSTQPAYTMSFRCLQLTAPVRRVE